MPTKAKGLEAVKPYYEQDGITIFHGDCREILPTLEKVDLVLTDPPYGLGDKWGGDSLGWSSCAGKLWDHQPEWDAKTADFDFVSLGKNAIVCGGNYYSFTLTNTWLGWDKMQKHTGSEAELAWTTLSQPVRVFRMSRVEAYCGKEGKSHPTQKPLDLIKWCLSFVPEAETILDPFMGSGTTLRAAKDLGRQAIGIEIEEKYCEIAANRLRQSVLPFG